LLEIALLILQILRFRD